MKKSKVTPYENNKKTLFVKIASFSCVLHCIFAPLLITTAPFLSNIFKNEFTEAAMLVTSIGLGSYIIYSGYCVHKKKQSIKFFILGSSLWIIHSLLEHLNKSGGEYLILIGTVFVLTSYMINHRQSERCTRQCCDNTLND